jgi:molybdenum cofactor biosynthesis protein B
MFDKRIDGFGELFRMLSFHEIGSAAMLSRATAGVAGGCVIFMLPGSEHAVRLAMNKLILPELGHLVYELTK